MNESHSPKGIHELYAEDPERAAEILWGKDAPAVTRRGFLTKSALGTLGAVLGANMVFGANFPAKLIPALLADSDDPFELDGKSRELKVLNDKPWNIETPAHLLDDRVTPADKMFVRNNGLLPASFDLQSWTLTIEGEAVNGTKTYTLRELKENFKQYTYQLTLECGGNGRAEFNPPAKGNQWTTGGVGCPSWTGIRLKDLLEDVGITDKAVYIGYEGADIHLSGDPDKVVISRGVPIEKALQEESLIAFQMNGQDIPKHNGYPLRLVLGGWPASVSGKWLTKILVRDRVHDGAKMEAPSYRVPCEPVAPGEEVKPEDMCIIHSMPVKSLITYPKSGGMMELGKTLDIRGHAWAGERAVKRMQFSIDFGATWQDAELEPAVNRLAWQHWTATVKFPQKGYYEVWAKATDDAGESQPMITPGWNPKGYLNNATHRIAIKVI
ncbi:molybdopterin-dependent oxidoreductase [Cryomorphaceae bacterium]|nr:molybdopterin-dependent oxidoreductase [Cryomorphaceae bacterium]